MLLQQRLDAGRRCVLAETDRELLCCRQFLSRVLTEATSFRRGQSVADLLSVMCWENASISETIIAMIASALEEKEDLRSYFRVSLALARIADSIAERRIDLLMSSLLNVIESQLNYWKTTDFCLEHLIRLARAVPAVAAWLSSPASRLKRVIDWLSRNMSCPRKAEVAFKPAALAKMQLYGGPVLGDFQHYGLTPPEKRSALVAIQQGELHVRSGFNPDSDDEFHGQELAVESLVDFRDNDGTWLLAKVLRFSANKLSVTLLCETGDEYTVDVCSQRIAPRYSKARLYTAPY